MGQSEGRSWELKFLVGLYLLTAAAGLQRLVSTIQTWSLLEKLLPFTPLYLVFCGLLWFILGIGSICWIWFNLKRIVPVIIISSLTIAVSYWLERLFLLRNEPAQTNLPFAVIITLSTLAFVFIVIFLPAQQKRFSLRS